MTLSMDEPKKTYDEMPRPLQFSELEKLEQLLCAHRTRQVLLVRDDKERDAVCLLLREDVLMKSLLRVFDPIWVAVRRVDNKEDDFYILHIYMCIRI
jgi:hypothetical protein